MTERTRLAVLGSPIAHSLSPAIHRAAYGVLGLEWTYDAIEQTEASVHGFLDSRDRSWRGLSLTMPLKRAVLPRLTSRDELVDVVGAANTVLITDDGLHGANTDVHGIVAAFAEAGIAHVDRAAILGSGATAASMLVALTRMGATDVSVHARTPAKAEPLVALGGRVGARVRVVDLAEPVRDVDVLASTLPGDAGAALDLPTGLRRSVPLFDVTYAPWPTTLAARWYDDGGTVVPGIDMLLHQAVGQLRVFLHGNSDASLADEPAVLAAMRAAV